MKAKAKEHIHICPDCGKQFSCWTFDCPYPKDARCEYCFHGYEPSFDDQVFLEAKSKGTYGRAYRIRACPGAE